MVRAVWYRASKFASDLGDGVWNLKMPNSINNWPRLWLFVKAIDHPSIEGLLNFVSAGLELLDQADDFVLHPGIQRQAPGRHHVEISYLVISV